MQQYTQSSKVTSASINWNLKIKRHFVKALMVNTKNANTLLVLKGAQGLKEIARFVKSSYIKIIPITQGVK